MSTTIITITHNCSQNGWYDIEIGRDNGTGTNLIRLIVSGATPSNNIPGYDTVLILFIAVGITSVLAYKFSKRRLKVEK